VLGQRIFVESRNAGGSGTVGTREFTQANVNRTRIFRHSA
jgi:hypothetical protein